MTSLRKSSNHLLQAFGHERQAFVVQALRCVRWLVVVWISIERSVRHHDRRVALLAKRPMIRPIHARKGRRQRGALRWEVDRTPERPNRLVNQRPATQVPNERDEVPS